MAKLYGNYGPIAQPWGLIGKFYKGLRSPVFKPLQHFIKQLLESPYPDAGLQGLTSMHDLLLGMNSSVMDEPHLRVRLESDGRILLCYPSGNLEAPTRGAKWVRRVPPEEAFVVLERFLVKRARWFRESRK